MTDKSKAPPKRMTMFSVESEDFIRFLREKGGGEEENCPVCKGPEWTIICPDDEGPVLRLGLPVRNREKTFFLSSIGYFCVNCGYIRTHLASVVHNWIQNNPAQDSDPVDDESLEQGQNDE